jgi:hypothetical protein
MAQKTRLMKSNLPRAIPNLRRCTRMLTRWSPSELNLRSSPVGFKLCWSTWASPPLPGSVKEVPRTGQVEFKAIAEIFFGSRILYRHKGLAFRISCSDAVADAAWQAITSWSVATRAGCRTRSTTSYLIRRRINSRPTG